jgi:hypothetical protein
MVISGTESSAAVATTGDCVHQARTDVGQEYAGLAGGAGVAVGGVRGGLLVPGDDELDGARTDRVEQCDVRVAAGAEDILDAVGLQLGDHRLRPGQARHHHCSPQIDMPRRIIVLITV